MTNRRDFLRVAGLASVAGLVPGLIACENNSNNNGSESTTTKSYAPSTTQAKNESWESIRQKFDLDPSYIHMSGLLLASHPKPVQDAINKYRKNLNENPAMYVEEQFSDLPERVRREAASYMAVNPTEIALTDSTTMGTSLLINGLHIRPNQEMIAANFDYGATHDALQFKANRSGASFRTFSSYQNIHSVSEEEIVDNYISQIRPNTRLVTATWVHSSTGLKIPVKQIADRLNEINYSRDPEDWALLLVDGVHGLGVEDTNISDLNCDFFTAGTHKWMFAPRGTGILWGNPRSQNQVSPTIPTFTNGAGWGGRMSPGGFKAFEHKWAMADAFQFHQEIGRTRVSERIHEFNQQLKEGLAEMNHVRLYTPMPEKLTAGMVCFDVDGLSRRAVVNRLRDMNVVASFTPYSPSYARLTPGIYNTSEEIENALNAVRDLS